MTLEMNVASSSVSWLSPDVVTAVIPRMSTCRAHSWMKTDRREAPVFSLGDLLTRPTKHGQCKLAVSWEALLHQVLPPGAPALEPAQHGLNPLKLSAHKDLSSLKFQLLNILASPWESGRLQSYLNAETSLSITGKHPGVLACRGPWAILVLSCKSGYLQGKPSSLNREEIN